MFPYISLSRRNPHTVIRSNICILWSLRQFSCMPTPSSTLSTSCYNFIMNAVCCLVVRVLGRSCRILCNTCILWGYFLFLTAVPSSVYAAVGPAWCDPFSSNCWWRLFIHGRGGGSATVPYLFLFLFTPPSSGCWPLAVYDCGGFSAFFGAVRIVLWCRLLMH